MKPVTVRILHLEAAPGSGPLERSLAAVRATLGSRLAVRFRDAGAEDVAIVAGAPDGTPFGNRLRRLVEAERPTGLVVVGSGALALALEPDLRCFLELAGSRKRIALTNNRHSADAIAVGCPEALLDLPDLPADNALPRWLADVAGHDVRDLRARRRLQIDVDGPVDALLVGAGWPAPAELSAVDVALERVREVAADRSAELLVAGRTSAATLRWLERCAAARVRALVEERGLRAGGSTNARRPRSVLGLALDERGPAALGGVVAELADGAIVDSRVLIAHRFGPQEAAWPVLEDRLASDLLLPARVADPWLRALTASAASAPVPIVLGSHTLVGPGVPFALRGAP